MPAPRQVYLHLGLQKTGTSYLQGVMRRNRDLLAEQGLDLVPAGRRESFELMLLLRGRYNPERDPASVGGALDRFTADLERAPGTRALLSQESLAASRPAQVKTLVEACGDREVHVVLTVRDLARQVPSSWQQELKAARTVTYERWLERLQEGERAGRGSHPWVQLDPPGVLARWAEVVPPERIHVVTVPAPGSEPTLLLERYCRVLGVRSGDLAPGPGAEQHQSGEGPGRAAPAGQPRPARRPPPPAGLRRRRQALVRLGGPRRAGGGQDPGARTAEAVVRGGRRRAGGRARRGRLPRRGQPRRPALPRLRVRSRRRHRPVRGRALLRRGGRPGAGGGAAGPPAPREAARGEAAVGGRTGGPGTPSRRQQR